MHQAVVLDRVCVMNRYGWQCKKKKNIKYKQNENHRTETVKAYLLFYAFIRKIKTIKRKKIKKKMHYLGAHLRLMTRNI